MSYKIASYLHCLQSGTFLTPSHILRTDPTLQSMRHPTPIRPAERRALARTRPLPQADIAHRKTPAAKTICLCQITRRQGGDANKKEVRDLCRAAVLLRFGY
jgi:hypothetical protein